MARPDFEGAVQRGAAGDAGACAEVQRPARVGSRFLLSRLLKCGVCGRPYSAQGAKSGQFAYYICGTLFTEGASTCTARYRNAPRVEDFVVEKIRERILTEATIVELVQLVVEEIDAMAGELSGRLEVVEAEKFAMTPVRTEPDISPPLTTHHAGTCRRGLARRTLSPENGSLLRLAYVVERPPAYTVAEG